MVFTRILAGLALLSLLASASAAAAQSDPLRQTKAPFRDAFRQLEGEAWPTPTDYRTASGAPGFRYWQQKVDYKIAVRLDEPAKTVSGRATITYHNNSPDRLSYLWLLMDQNIFKRDSIAERTQTAGGRAGASAGDDISLQALRRIARYKNWEGGFTLKAVQDGAGHALPHKVVDTLMRVDLPQGLASGGTTTLVLEWSYPMIEGKVIGGRDGYECFTGPGQDGNCIFEGAQWYPRLARYTDYEGWHNKAFLGAGEFTLEFGDYDVSLTVPNDHVVAATGELTNAAAVLSAAQRARLAQAHDAREPVYVVTPPEAVAAEAGKPTGEKTWTFHASNVRDFAWASSRKFVWDALGVKQDYSAQPLVMAMSFYPKEGRPLWDAWSTKAIAHTIKVYSEFAFPYPYSKAQSINGPVGGMEYPMMTFNGPRPTKDKKTGDLTYSERTKNGLIGVVIHEIGHTYFPMVVNSDERQWTWMDEGINSFLQFEAEKRWSKDFPSRGEPRSIVEYMVSQNQVPIMTQSDSIGNLGANSYAKPATALVILRETVLGRELFDKAFKDYATRWRFKGPTPYDFFRTMEESSGVDLDWFWRGWFYSTDHVDIALDGVTAGKLDPIDAGDRNARKRATAAAEPQSLTAARNTEPTVVENDPKVRDIYDAPEKFPVTAGDRRRAAAGLADLTPEERVARTLPDTFYRFSFRNVGGVVMPIVLKLDFNDGSSETIHIPAEVWRRDSEKVVWPYQTTKTLRRAEVDPLWETADADRSNNVYEGSGAPRTLRIAAPFGGAQDDDRIKDDGLRVSPDGLQPLPATTGSKEPPASAGGMAPPPPNAPAAKRGEPGGPAASVTPAPRSGGAT